MTGEENLIIKFLKKYNDVDVYEINLPDDFNIPCMFFPSVQKKYEPDSVTTFREVTMWPIKIVESSTELSYQKANELASLLLVHKLKIPLLKDDGTETNEKLRLRLVEVKKDEDETIELQLTWSMTYEYNKETYVKIQEFNVETDTKKI